MAKHTPRVASLLVTLSLVTATSKTLVLLHRFDARIPVMHVLPLCFFVSSNTLSSRKEETNGSATLSNEATRWDCLNSFSETPSGMIFKSDMAPLSSGEMLCRTRWSEELTLTEFCLIQAVDCLILPLPHSSLLQKARRLPPMFSEQNFFYLSTHTFSTCPLVPSTPWPNILRLSLSSLALNLERCHAEHGIPHRYRE